MTEIAEQLKSQLSQLPKEDRAELAHFLIRSLDEEEDADTTAAWEAELTRRLEEIESGQVVGELAEDVFREMREKHS